MPSVLVVDDDPDIRSVIAFKLQRAGFTVHLEADGEAGLAAATEERPDLVLLDWMMPRLNGMEVCRAIRDDASLEGTTVIMLTAKAQEPDVQRALAVGADDYILKPFSPRELVSRVQAILARPARRPTDAIDRDAHGSAQLPRGWQPRVLVDDDMVVEGGLGRSAGANDPPRNRAFLVSAAQARESLFDPTGLLKFADAGQISELTEMFSDQMTARLPALGVAIAGGDSKATHEIAHGLKGSAATIGAPRVMNVCDAICRAAMRGEKDRTAALHSELVDVWKDTAGAITACLRDLNR